MVDETGALTRPIELGHIFQIWSKLAAHGRHRPHADAGDVRSVGFANPEGHLGCVRRERDGADRRIREITNAAVRQVVKLAGANLGHPDIHRSVAVCEKRDELPVARDASCLLGALEVRHDPKLCVRKRVLPEKVRSFQEPDGCRHGENGPGSYRQPDERPSMLSW